MMFQVSLTAILFTGIGFSVAYILGWDRSFKRYWRHFVVEGKGRPIYGAPIYRHD